MTTLHYRTLSDATGPDFEAYYAVYAASIPAHEQKPRAAMAALLPRADYLHLLQRDADGTPLGMATLYTAPGAGFALLEYLAVDGRIRSRGLGAALFGEGVQQALARQPEGAPLVLEVDALTGIPGPIEEQNVRRQAFYRRLGCRRLQGLRYILPLPSDGPPPPMDLWIFTPGTAHVSVPRDTVRAWLVAIYTQVYAQPSADPRIDEMLAPMPATISLEA